MPRDGSEAILRAGNLTGCVRVIELQRIGPHDGRQALAFFMVGRQVERERELDAVCSFISHQLFGNAVELRRRIRKVSDCFFVRAIRRADKIIGRLRGTLMAGQELRAIVGQEARPRTHTVHRRIERCAQISGYPGQSDPEKGTRLFVKRRCPPGK